MGVRIVQRVTCPTAVIHGVVDEVVPFHHGVQMHAALPSSQTYPPLWIKRGGHVSRCTAIALGSAPGRLSLAFFQSVFGTCCIYYRVIMAAPLTPWGLAVHATPRTRTLPAMHIHGISVSIN